MGQPGQDADRRLTANGIGRNKRKGYTWRCSPGGRDSESAG